MSDKYAYQASDELAAALRSAEVDLRQFHQEVQAAWDAEHPDTPSLWARGMVDRKCVGFKDPGGDVPVGLSRSKQRVELIPARGKVGDSWREALVKLNSGPKIGDVFGRFGIDPTILVVDHGRLYYPGILVTDDAVFLTWGAPIESPGPHLTPVPLSAYYAAAELADRERAS